MTATGMMVVIEEKESIVVGVNVLIVICYVNEVE